MCYGGDTGKLVAQNGVDTGKLVAPNSVDTGKLVAPNSGDTGKLVAPNSGDTGKLVAQEPVLCVSVFIREIIFFPRGSPPIDRLCDDDVMGVQHVRKRCRQLENGRTDIRCH
jgi:hypothetical protein